MAELLNDDGRRVAPIFDMGMFEMPVLEVKCPAQGMGYHDFGIDQWTSVPDKRSGIPGAVTYLAGSFYCRRCLFRVDVYGAELGPDEIPGEGMA